MENFMIRHQTRMPSSSSSTPSQALSIHKNSQTISKAKPKIRIIHIFAPEIIKTDVANFRELVQRLTGKPPQDRNLGCKRKRRNNINAARIDHFQEPRVVVSTSTTTAAAAAATFCDQKPSAVMAAAAMAAKKMELRTGFLAAAGLETRERVKEEEGIVWNNSTNGENSGGFLTGFGDLDGFIQELGDFPFLPLDASHHMHGFEEAQLA